MQIAFTREREAALEYLEPFAGGNWGTANTDGYYPICYVHTNPSENRKANFPARFVRGASAPVTPTPTTACTEPTSLTIHSNAGCWFEKFKRIEIQGKACGVYSDAVTTPPMLCAVPGGRVLKTNGEPIEYSYCYVANPSSDIGTLAGQFNTCWSSGSKVVSGTFTPPSIPKAVNLAP